jgi:hypothetical protein
MADIHYYGPTEICAWTDGSNSVSNAMVALKAPSSTNVKYLKGNDL